MARDRPTSEALFRYADLRMERLVKVTRSVVGEILDGRAEECYPLLEPIRLYADLLAQALVEGRYSAFAERRMIAHLRLANGKGGDSAARTERLAERMQGDGRACSRIPPGVPMVSKRGAIGLSSGQLYAWVSWLRGVRWDTVDAVIAILSRGLTEGAIVARILGLPVRFICYSRRRLSMRQVQLLDASRLALGGRRVLLVDAHARSGETLSACAGALSTAGLDLTGALITDYEGSPRGIGPFTQRVEIGKGGWAALHPVSADRPRSKAMPQVPSRQPILALIGKPGCGKTVVRKALVHSTGWPAFSWARGVRELLVKLGGRTMSAVRALTMEEAEDPEIVAREFLAGLGAHHLDPDKPVVIEGAKSWAGLRMVGRHWGRAVRVVRVTRSSFARQAALEERGDFDDRYDEERAALLEKTGLSTLLSMAQLTVDASDSTSDRESGLTHVGPRTVAEVMRLASEYGSANAAMRVRRKTAKWLLLAPSGSLFLLLRSARTHKWGIPGGELAAGETPFQAAVRELSEETGQAEPPGGPRKMIEVRRCLNLGGRLVDERISYVFLARALSTQVRLSGEHVEARWATEAEAAAVLARPIRDLLADAILEFATP